MYRAIFFDLDGTLLDTSRDINGTLNDVMRRFGLPEVSMADTLKFIGNGARELIRLAIGPQNAARVDEINGVYVREFSACNNEHATLYEGEDRALRAFADSGIKLGIISNKPQAAAERVVKLFFSNYGFAYVQGQRDGIPLKPDPKGLLSAIESLGLKKEECLFVGDGETDARTAINAGVDGISVLWGYRTLQQLSAAGATRFAHSFDELQNMVFAQEK